MQTDRQTATYQSFWEKYIKKYIKKVQKQYLLLRINHFSLEIEEFVCEVYLFTQFIYAMYLCHLFIYAIYYIILVPMDSQQFTDIKTILI